MLPPAAMAASTLDASVPAGRGAAAVRGRQRADESEREQKRRWSRGWAGAQVWVGQAKEVEQRLGRGA
eukprot:7068306-Prymnesium_polylepis.1